MVVEIHAAWISCQFLVSVLEKGVSREKSLGRLRFINIEEGHVYQDLRTVKIDECIETCRLQVKQSIYFFDLNETDVHQKFQTSQVVSSYTKVVKTYSPGSSVRAVRGGQYIYAAL